MSGRPPGGPVDVFGPYRVYEELGKGGMATVHRAEKSGVEGFKKTVALKRMLPHVAANQDMVAAFVREARLASFLRHGNVAQTYELGKVGDIYFIAMELVEGRNLREVLRRLAQNRSSMPVPIAMNIVNQICDALDYAHNLCDHDGQRLGIIHRDVSPANIIVSDEGIVKLIDFGIAKASAQGMQTMSGTIKGKFGYMAPEYLAGRIDARADLFAVGVIAHELLTNRPLFSTGDDMQTLLRVREMQIEPPSRTNRLVPHEIDEIIMTALERDPDKRWQVATALRNAMTTVTRRLGLHVESTRVVEWLEKFDFDESTQPLARKKSRAYIDEFEVGGESMVISVEDAPPVANFDAVTNNAIASAPGLAEAPPRHDPERFGLAEAPPRHDPERFGLAEAPPRHDPERFGLAEALGALPPTIPPPSAVPLGSQPPQELSTSSRNRAEYQAALAQYEQRSASADFDVPTTPRTSTPNVNIPRTVTPSAVASMAQGRTTGPHRTLIGVSGQIPIPHTTPGSGPISIQRAPSGPISAQLPSPVRSSADMAATSLAPTPTPTTKTSGGGGRGIAIMLLVLLLIGGGVTAAYFLL